MSLRPAEFGPGQRAHVIRIVVVWLVCIVIAELLLRLIAFPPGDLSVQADDQSKTLYLLSALAVPVFFGVIVWMLYCLFFFRQPRDSEELVSGPPVYGNVRIQVLWVVVSSIIVVALAAYGTLTLVSSEAAKAIGAPSRTINTGNAVEGGAGEGPANGQSLVVQVIAQQWYFTYRWPQYGGIETTHLELPENTRVEFHVTSLDVIHSFWAYEIGAKSDAVAGNDNIAYVTTENHTGTFHVRCGELCGLWHGEMADASDRVVSQSDFNSWIGQQQQYFASIKSVLPPYSKVYYPLPLTKGT